MSSSHSSNLAGEKGSTTRPVRRRRHHPHTGTNTTTTIPVPPTSSGSRSSTASSRSELLCELRQRYLHQWPNLSALLVTTRPGESLGDTPSSTQQEQQYFTLDKTPDYLYPSRVPALMKALLFDNNNNNNNNNNMDAATTQQQQQQTKIVVILRNPIDRAYSHYRMGQRMMREEHIPFETFLERELNLLRDLGLTDFHLNNNNNTKKDTTKKFSWEELDHLYDNVSDQLKGHNYLSRGLYAMQLERYVRHGLGGNETLLVLPYPWLKTQPELVYSRLLKFAGMPDHTLSEETLNFRFNYNNVVTDPLANATRARLEQFFGQPNQALADLLAQQNHSQDYEWQDLLAS